ncbi:MAG: CoA-binding protein [Verrucomicrobiaceae bacterium]
MNVAILGASPKPERYAHKAQLLLTEHQHTVLPISPTGAEILGIPGYQSISDITEPIDTLTLYLGPDRLAPLIPEIIRAKPQRIIFNPGTESPEAQTAFQQAGIKTENACTLVLLHSRAF